MSCIWTQREWTQRKEGGGNKPPDAERNGNCLLSGRGIPTRPFAAGQKGRGGEGKKKGRRTKKGGKARNKSQRNEIVVNNGRSEREKKEPRKKKDWKVNPKTHMLFGPSNLIARDH